MVKIPPQPDYTLVKSSAKRERASSSVGIWIAL